MSTLLEQNDDTQITQTDQTVTPRELLGSGGQGEVWRATLDGEDVALKWYNRSSATKTQREILRELIDRGAPDDRFLWPEALVEAEARDGFGYVMRLRPDRFVSITKLLDGRIDPSFGALARAAALLADGFLELHHKGLAYCDISYGNVFLDPDSGDILICDNDNVVIDGSDEMGIGGTPAFMAPEIVRGEAMPSSDTDRHSLAVLLFYMLLVGHPLEGAKVHGLRCMDAPARERVFGQNPVFIFDPDDDTNRPVPGVHDHLETYWDIYPGYIKELFVQAFTDGLHDPTDGRVRESQWRKAFSRLLASQVHCDCGAGNFYDRQTYKQRGGVPDNCWKCGAQLDLPPRMLVHRKDVLCLETDTELYGYHLTARRGDGFDSPLARVTERDGERGLKNLGDNSWKVSTDDSTVTVPPGKAVSLRDGFRIDFGGSQGVVRVG